MQIFNEQDIKLLLKFKQQLYSNRFNTSVTFNEQKVKYGWKKFERETVVLCRHQKDTCTICEKYERPMTALSILQEILLGKQHRSSLSLRSFRGITILVTEQKRKYWFKTKHYNCERLRQCTEVAWGLSIITIKLL